MARSILITGCSSGIGRHCALAMARRGWRVFATARNEADLAALHEAGGKHGLEALYLDYADEASIAAALQSVLAATDGRLDALFNNGAYSQPGALEDISSAVLRAQFDANFFGWHELTRKVIPVMRRQNAGRIVMNSSVLGLVALGFRGAYNSSKFALEGYTDTLRIELADTGIKVVAIEPGPIESRMTENAVAAFHRNVDIDASVHAAYYRRRLASMEKGGNTFGQLGPEAVLDVLIEACEAPSPATHYPVTRQTRIAAFGRRLLPRRLLHKMATRATN
ncbi:SDR family NAD(P)-dependent oxidoreductase [Afifella marina]|uniref:Short-chain dehydrogenase n=1 Tax=Afifella marina DSM 2698 TaxID=1120955 RepID=A0A1G5NQR5_AFIMA|nr:SDR family NAD(P)-dependent oxidoreductase [Afifella marina]MBK1624542.1 short-chain dehydrogenase [Afifella marina DSM 2698]MBK1627435.1 short-chain dehydrogenase [Afifella marina]MBK5918493.1 short-chain dehydrogenase [Afifella marina]RAI20648.1 short-chain dehydrogenase [Afifella marina DSM 2698]SCZ39131.1 Short-chain dehydrogenase [Afifella marina DSM 2698]